MNTKFKNQVNVKELIFWKSFLYVFVFYYVISLCYKLIKLELIYEGLFFSFFSKAAVSSLFLLFPIAPILSFLVTYFAIRRLLNENPKKVFTVGLAKLSLAFLILELLLVMSSLFIVGGELGSFVISFISYQILPIPLLLLWLYLSTLWLYKSFKKQNRLYI